jgi:hypothetical protein
MLAKIDTKRPLTWLLPMGRARRIEGALQDVLDLRLAAHGAADERRQRLEAVARRRRQELGQSVPKGKAAAVLGVSVTTLDKWIERGALPVVRRAGSARVEVEADALLELAVEVQRLRDAGRRRGLLAHALRRLGWSVPLRRADPAKTPEPAAMGMPGYFPDPLRGWRADFEGSTAADRVAQAISLSRTATRIAAAAKAAALRLVDDEWLADPPGGLEGAEPDSPLGVIVGGENPVTELGDRDHAHGNLFRELAERASLLETEVSSRAPQRASFATDRAGIIVGMAGLREKERPSSRRDFLRRERGRILDFLAQRGVHDVRVFGSVARGDDDCGSDIDLLIELAESGSRGGELLTALGLSEELSELLGVRIDVATARTLRSDVRERALADAVRL